MEAKTIFILGNGFDLAHYLPTAYIHFMGAMMVIENSEVDSALSFVDLFASRIEDKHWFFEKTIELYKTDELILPSDKVNELREKLQNNGWFQHFKNHLSKTEMTWIDFESEINNVLTAIKFIINQKFTHETIKHTSVQILSFIFAKSEDILDDNEKVMNSSLLDVAILDKDYYFSILNNFAITYTIYGKFFYDGNQVLSATKLSKRDYKEFEVFQNNHSGEYRNGFKTSFERIINTEYLTIFNNKYTGLNGEKIFQKLSDDLLSFNDIFEEYISQVVNKLEPKKPFFPFGDLGKKIDSVYTFNYSNTFERLYPNAKLHYEEVQHVHGNAEDKNIVLGISDLPDELKQHKIYSFVKTFQKIINRTDYEFLSHHDVSLEKEHKHENQYREYYEIIVWGHSLDISDEEYIKEIFKLNNELLYNSVRLEVWFHEKPHDSLANLMNIMGKDVIQEWVKRNWLWLKTPAPDVYSLNNRR